MNVQDIQLKIVNDGEYDRVFYINDFKIVENFELLENSIIISLMTRLGEMDHNFTYNSFGCGAWTYIKQNYTQLNKLNIEKAIKKSLKKIKGIKKVEKIQLETQPHNQHTITVYFTITLENNL